MTLGERRLRRDQLLIGLCGIVVVVSLSLSVWTVIRQGNADTIRAADKKSQATTQVAQCFQQVKNAPQVLQILDLINTQGQLIDTLATNSIIANSQAIEATPGDALNDVRRDSLKRLIPARDRLRTGRPALERFILRTAENAPTKKSCNELADTLGVDPSQLDQP